MCGLNGHTVVSIGRLTAFYVVLVPKEYIPSEPPHSAYVIVSFVLSKKVPLFSVNIGFYVLTHLRRGEGGANICGRS